ncbi:hypothetical protein B4135_0855 [Caldibacillus debilis]|uniref:Uncharacterized protein n=1 Tax=Caldibacillus debilis TaxID=301148 RepID=A0A150M6E3_9BACI|nr:hypothetical protein B4135_0855 [Caldibacillus debilis]
MLEPFSHRFFEGFRYRSVISQEGPSFFGVPGRPRESLSLP